MPTPHMLRLLGRTVITIAIVFGLAHIAERTAAGAVACARTHCIHDGGLTWPAA